jgi:hypothetical protein
LPTEQSRTSRGRKRQASAVPGTYLAIVAGADLSQDSDDNDPRTRMPRPIASAKEKIMFRKTTILIGVALALGSSMLPVAAYARGGGSAAHAGGSVVASHVGGGTFSGGHVTGGTTTGGGHVGHRPGHTGAGRGPAGSGEARHVGLGLGQGNSSDWSFQYCGPHESAWQNSCHPGPAGQ